jgi:hypothetical protein
MICSSANQVLIKCAKIDGFHERGSHLNASFRFCLLSRLFRIPCMVFYWLFYLFSSVPAGHLSGIVDLLLYYYIANAVNASCMYDFSGLERADFTRESAKLNRISNYVHILLILVLVNCRIVRSHLVTKAHRPAEIQGFFGIKQLRCNKNQKKIKKPFLQPQFLKKTQNLLLLFLRKQRRCNYLFIL